MSGALLVVSLFVNAVGLAFVLSRRGTGKPIGPDMAVFCLVLLFVLAFFVALAVGA